MTQSIENFPQPGFRDHARTGIDAALAAIPYIGGPAQVLANAVMAPSLQKRRERWLEVLGEVVEELERRLDGFDPKNLAADEAFISAVITASRIAIGTHLEEKLNILKNCLLHMAVDEARDDFIVLFYFRAVDELTPEHFLILRYLSNPSAWFDAKGISRPTFLSAPPSALFSEARLPVTGTGLEIVLRELSDRGLADTASLSTVMSGQGVWQSRSTSLGTSLLHFVSDI